jgi:hypothetical protein
MENYIVWCEDYGQNEEDARRINAYDGWSAAREWAKWHDQEYAEYEIAKGDEKVVTVKEISSGLVEQYNVIGESVLSYWSRKVHNA